MALNDFVFNSLTVLFSLVFVFHYYFTTHIKVDPNYRQRLKWKRCWHVDVEGCCWNGPCKAAREAALAISVSELRRGTAGVNAEPDGFHRIIES